MYELGNYFISNPLSLLQFMDSVDIKILHSMSRQLLVQTEGKMTLSIHLVYMSQQEVCIFVMLLRVVCLVKSYCMSTGKTYVVVVFD